ALWDPEESATNENWIKYKKKGAWLGCLLDATDEEAGKAWPNFLNRNPPSISSEWQGTLESELATWGWRESKWDQEDHCDFTAGFMGRGNVKSAFYDLHLSALPKTQGGDNVCYAVEHYDDQKLEDDYSHGMYYHEYYTVNGQQYRLTGGSYCFGVNQKGGALIAKLLRSPLSAAQEYWGEDSDDDDDHDNMPSLSSMPALRRPSDIMAAYWLRNNLAPKSLSYYFALDVQNDETLPLITSVLDRRGLERMPPWPGVKVGMWEEEGEALLGSPLGAIVAYLLVQHKENLGRKHVTEITIFREDDVIGEQQDMVEVNLLFWIKDVP
ncbi:hypothetical protein IQ06DRAFT_204231, partial [Phaeosphaeriaceae sp. SRC1lsM3a]